MEFLASLAIKALIGTSVCGSVTIVAIHQYDKTLLGFKDNAQTETKTGGQGGDNSTKPEVTKEEKKDNTSDSLGTPSTKGEDDTSVVGDGAEDSDSTSTDNIGVDNEKVNPNTNGVDVPKLSEGVEGSEKEEETSGTEDPGAAADETTRSTGESGTVTKVDDEEKQELETVEREETPKSNKGDTTSGDGLDTAKPEKQTESSEGIARVQSDE